MHAFSSWWQEHWGGFAAGAVIVLFASMILYLVVWRLVTNIVKFACRLYLRFAGERKVGTIVSTRGMGNSVNAMPVLRLEIQVVDANGTARVHTFRKLCDLGNLPRAGNSIDVYVSKTHPSFFVPA